jgi:hypothetical protein
VNLGKIEKITIGVGGYQDAMFGVTFNLSSQQGSCVDFWGWFTTEPCTKWTEEDRIKKMGESFWKLYGIMRDAKVNDTMDLVGKPIEIVFENGRLSSWRILKEVL